MFCAESFLGVGVWY
uniref:Uncharacterized protein n=1 Tax=Arundo donax TaxID=35708 RepID=A0A0A9ALX6_ARUDO